MTSDGAQRGGHVRQHPCRLDQHRLRAHGRRPPPAGTTVTAWTDLTGLPHFDPDLDRDPLPAPVAALRDLLSGADAVVLCTPEYAGALPGAFKNALDWTVGSTVFSDKPAAWIKVAADARRGEGAHAELATVLGTSRPACCLRPARMCPSTATPSTLTG